MRHPAGLRLFFFMLFPSLFVCIVIALAGCSGRENEKRPPTEKPLFSLLAPTYTNIHFANTLTEGLNTNVLMYEYFYNGGGVAIGDVNNDGLQDIYFTANMVDNKLYLNRGDMRFEDITAKAGVEGRPGPWKTGVTMADVNGDGKVDIFVCYSGKINGRKRIPQLFVNQGNDSHGLPQFSDETAAYGLNDSAFSNQAYFFDYDRDGDLDMLLINHNPERLSNLNEATIRKYTTTRSEQSGTRLFRNHHHHFEEATAGSGIVNNMLSYNLAAAVADVNDDGWPDIYISNDYLAPDYLYINNGDGTFTDRLKDKLDHTSQFSMGNNIADIDNDGLPDLYTLDMLPEDNHRQKMLFAPDNYALFDINVRSGFHRQYMRNMLQLNNGNGTFSEMGQLAGVSNTDWSWAPLFADFDNDGWKDLFVTNGYLRDYTNMDFLVYMSDQLQRSAGGVRRQQLLGMLQHMPSSDVKNYVFRNNGDLTFSNMRTGWGIDSSSNSNGAAYADLDNDGDLDLVVNNINAPAFVYRNETDANRNHFLEVSLHGEAGNTQGLGAKLYVYTAGKKQYYEQMTAKGYQSSVTPVLHVGLGEANTIDSLVIVWPSGKTQVLRDAKSNQVIVLKEADANRERTPLTTPAPLFEQVPPPVAYQDSSGQTNDFNRQPLLVNPLSYTTPCMVKGDVNGDGLDDLYVGGGSGKRGCLFIQRRDGSFAEKRIAAFEADRSSEDADGLFFDANGDGHNDLYVVSGGYGDFQPDDSLLQDRLYINDGKGNFTRSRDALPDMRVSKSCVRKADINGDDYADLFVGGRVIPGRFPVAPRSYVLMNDGKGNFTDATSSIAASLERPGMVTDAAWLDLNNDGRQDLIVVGEWMPVTIFINTGRRLEDSTSAYFNNKYVGWWNKISVADMNKDGRADLVVGNLGANTQCTASDRQPAEMYYKDFDGNGTVEPILCYYIQGKSYPFVSRDEVVSQINGMSKKFKYYKDYADATITDLFTPEQLKDAVHLKANILTTTYFERGGDGKFNIKNLPIQAQLSPVFAILPFDFNKDGNEDILLCGNISNARLRFGSYDANQGVLLQGDGRGSFTSISQQRSGFHLRGDVRSVQIINDKLLFGISQQKIDAYRLRATPTSLQGPGSK